MAIRSGTLPTWMERRPALASAVLGSLLALLIAGILGATTDFLSCGDCERYQDIANNPFIFTASPWGYRIFVPYLARALATLTPLTLDQGFLFLTLFGFCLLGTAFVYWLSVVRRYPLSVAALVFVLYAASFGAIVYLHGYQNIGIWEHLVLFLGMIAIYHNRWIWLVPLLVVGEVVKESVVVLIPLYLVCGWLLGDQPRRVVVRNTAILAAVYLAMFLLLRSGLLWQKGGNTQDYVSYYTPAYFEWLFSVYGGPIRAVPKTLAITAVTLPLAIVGFLVAGRRDRIIALMAPLAASQLLFGGDVERLMLMAYLGFAPLIAALFARVSLLERLLLSALGVAAFYVHYYLTFSPRSFDPVTGAQPLLRVSQGLMLTAALAVGLWYWLRFRPRRNAERPGGGDRKLARAGA